MQKRITEQSTVLCPAAEWTSMHFISFRFTYLVGVWPSVRHGESPAAIVLVVGMKFVRKGDIVSPDRRFLSRGVGRVPSLNHKPANVSVEYRPGVLASRSEGQKVKGRPRAGVAVDLAF